MGIKFAIYDLISIIYGKYSNLIIDKMQQNKIVSVLKTIHIHQKSFCKLSNHICNLIYTKTCFNKF